MLLDALKCQNTGRPPVWLMRQAGRYMPSYRKLRAKHTLRELFFTPELAADITMLPVDELAVDAAILFSDITVTSLMLGFDLDFQEGPLITGSFKRKSIDTLSSIEKTIHLIKKRSPVPLIGFVGAPFTVSCYMGKDLAMLDNLFDVTVEYIQMQEKAGCDAIQIFDSWADELSDEDFKKYSLYYLKKLTKAAKVPVILFMKNASKKIQLLHECLSSAISIDSQVRMDEIRKISSHCLQGNLDPDLLYKPIDQIQKETQNLLESMRGDRGFIVNLSHGCRPDFDFNSVKALVDTVKNFK